MDWRIRKEQFPVCISMILGVISLFASYFIYATSQYGYTECGSQCDWWLDFVFPPQTCVMECVEKYYPDPIYRQLFYLGSFLFIVIPFISFCISSLKNKRK